MQNIPIAVSLSKKEDVAFIADTTFRFEHNKHKNSLAYTQGLTTEQFFDLAIAIEQANKATKNGKLATRVTITLKQDETEVVFPDGRRECLNGLQAKKEALAQIQSRLQNLKIKD